jgi:imidazolonepropionase-like amidohydrolase
MKIDTPPPSVSSRPYRLNNAALFDGYRHHGDTRFAVIVQGDRIASVGPAEPPSSDELVIDVSGRTVMPGLIDAHCHCNSPFHDVVAGDALAPSHLAQYARKYLEESLLRGFTTLRDAGGADTGLKRALRDGLILGPRLYTSGLGISQTGGHGDFRVGSSLSCGCAGYAGSLSRVVNGVDEMRSAVRDELRRGADQIKLFVSGGVSSPTDPVWMDQFDDDEIRAAVVAAERRRTYVMAHAITAQSVRRCVELGIRSIEHGFQIDRETADIIAVSGSYLVGTLYVILSVASGARVLPPAAMEKAKTVIDAAVRAIEHARAAGVRIGLGTDLRGQMQGRELHELEVRAQIDGNLNTLRSATSVNAEIMQLEGQLGCISKGAFADMLILDGDPTQDIGVLTKSAPHMIIKAGDRVPAARPESGRSQGSFV